jgi:thiol-disulfide isomerase/thioredoxin
MRIPSHRLRVAPLLVVVLAALLTGPAGAAPPPPAPPLSGDAWLNTEPLSLEALRGKVVLVEFWTFACWNCKNVEPYVKDWHARYADEGLVVIAVHTPEFEREKKLENVRRYVAEHEITHPVLIDNGFTTWRRYGNRYWPALYLIDKQGRLRHKRIGEGDYERTESWIQRLLGEPTEAR